MFYRVDYVCAVMGAGFLLGVFTGKWTLRSTASRVAQTYFDTVMVLLALSSISLTFRLTLGHGPAWTGVIGDLSGLLYGALFGIAVRRDDRRALLLDRAVLSALAISIAVTFASAGLGKAFSMAPMHEFFAQSGYFSALHHHCRGAGRAGHADSLHRARGAGGIGHRYVWRGADAHS